MDGSYAVVKFPAKEAEVSANKEDLQSLLQDCRLLRKDELMIVKGTSAPRVPDCFQRTPKRVMVTDSGQILAVTVDGEGEQDLGQHGRYGLNSIEHIILVATTGSILLLFYLWSEVTVTHLKIRHP